MFLDNLKCNLGSENPAAITCKKIICRKLYKLLLFIFTYHLLLFYRESEFLLDNLASKLRISALQTFS